MSDAFPKISKQYIRYGVKMNGIAVIRPSFFRTFLAFSVIHKHPFLPLGSSIDLLKLWQNVGIHINQVSLVEPLASSILLTLEFYVAHTAQPIHKDTPVPSHEMPHTYTAAAYAQSSYQLATSVTQLKHVT